MSSGGNVYPLGHHSLSTMRAPLRTTTVDSRRMARIRQSSTRPELAVRRALRNLGVHYRLNVKSLPGRPDVANVSRKFAVFVHGCFWHRHKGCRRTTTPRRNREFWLQKFAANIKRDRRTIKELRAMGYRVGIVWECETEDPILLKSKLCAALGIESIGGMT